MAIEINGKVYRNLEEQVQKNKEDIKRFLSTNVVSVNGKSGEVVLKAEDIMVKNSQSVQANLERIDSLIEDLQDLVNSIKAKTDLIEIEENSITINAKPYKYFSVAVDNGAMNLNEDGLEVTSRIFAPNGIKVDYDAIIEVGDESLSVIDSTDATKVLGN